MSWTPPQLALAENLSSGMGYCWPVKRGQSLWVDWRMGDQKLLKSLGEHSSQRAQRASIGPQGRGQKRRQGWGMGSAAGKSHDLEVVRNGKVSMAVHALSYSSLSMEFSKLVVKIITICVRQHQKILIKNAEHCPSGQPQKWASTPQKRKDAGNTHSFTHRRWQPVASRWGSTRSDGPTRPWSSGSAKRRGAGKDMDVMPGTHRCHENDRAQRGLRRHW